MHMTPAPGMPGLSPIEDTSRNASVLGARVSVSPRAGRDAARDKKGNFMLELELEQRLPGVAQDGDVLAHLKEGRVVQLSCT